MNILLVGHVCIDENISEKVTYTSWGSALMYMAKYLMSKPDCNVSLLAPYGKDFLRYKEGTHLINKPSGDHTLIYRNVSKDGIRQQVAKYTECARPIKITNDIKEMVRKADIIVFATLLPNYSYDYISQLLHSKRPSCLTALLPQGHLRNISIDGSVSYNPFTEYAKILPLFDMVFVSNEDIPKVETVLKTWAKVSPNSKVIMTEAEKGACIVRNDGIVQINTTAIPKDMIIDSVGCGDTFSAATIYEYFKSHNIEQSIRAGNKAAGDKLLTAKS